MNTYGLIGKNIDYSFSKNYFNNKFKKEGIENAQYINFDIDNIGKLNNIFKQKNQGYNVTIPYKEAVIPYLDALNNHADRKSTRLNSSHVRISYAVFCLKKKKKNNNINTTQL